MSCGRVAERIRWLEGRQVSVVLANGTRIDRCELVSAGRHGVDTVWLHAGGTDTFVALVDVMEVHEAAPFNPGPP